MAEKKFLEDRVDIPNQCRRMLTHFMDHVITGYEWFAEAERLQRLEENGKGVYTSEIKTTKERETKEDDAAVLVFNDLIRCVCETKGHIRE